jgi:hypothetical protein
MSKKGIMIKQMRGWKVISEQRLSINKDYFSIEYPINQIVAPTLEGSKLFFFKNKKDAVNFSNSFVNKIIVPCIAYNCTKGKLMSGTQGYDKVFWMRKELHKKTWGVTPPKGTWFAEKLSV